jgi:hypothetical protein
MVNMDTKRRWLSLPGIALGLLLTTLAGCQTWVPTAGVTLPSPEYLDHPPQYIPPSGVFPLPREEASMAAIAARPAGAAVLPAPLPGGPGR